MDPIVLEGHELRLYRDPQGKVAYGATTPRAVMALEAWFKGTWVETADGRPVFLVPGLRVEDCERITGYKVGFHALVTGGCTPIFDDEARS